MLAVIGGIIAVFVGIVLLFGGPLFNLPLYMWDDFVTCLKGMFSSGIVLGGLLAIIAGVSSIKDKIKSKSEENK